MNHLPLLLKWVEALDLTLVNGRRGYLQHFPPTFQLGLVRLMSTISETFVLKPSENMVQPRKSPSKQSLLSLGNGEILVIARELNSGSFTPLLSHVTLDKPLPLSLGFLKGCAQWPVLMVPVPRRWSREDSTSPGVWGQPWWLTESSSQKGGRPMIM